MACSCTHCGHNSYNSRISPGNGVKLFGVTLRDGCVRMSMCKEGQMNCSSQTHNSSSPTGNSESVLAAANRFRSEGTTQVSSLRRERKKGMPWTTEEHRMFLEGLKKLGKGDWRGISKGFVITRTPTQVASHAQKYFNRQCNVKKPKRRSSLFDITPEVAASEILEEEVSATNSEAIATMNRSSLSQNLHPTSDLGLTVVPFSFHLFPAFVSTACSEPPVTSNIAKPVAVLPTGPIKIDSSNEISELKLSISPPAIEPSFVSLTFSESRNAAFHENASFSNGDLNPTANAIKVV